jgi:hypothetical protein
MQSEPTPSTCPICGKDQVRRILWDWVGLGVCVVDPRRGQTIALLRFESGVQEVFAVAVRPRRFPDLINDNDALLESSFVVPSETLGEVAASVRVSRDARFDRIPFAVRIVSLPASGDPPC